MRALLVCLTVWMAGCVPVTPVSPSPVRLPLVETVVPVPSKCAGIDRSTYAGWASYERCLNSQ